MKIKLNNREEQFEHNHLTVADLLDKKKFSFKMLVVKINNRLVKKQEYDKATISDGDEVSVIHLISGG